MNRLKSLHFLLSNDDGVFAPGLEALAKAVLPFGKVTIAAPNRERSASSHSLTIEHPIRAKKTPFPVEVSAAFAITGTPSDCVKLALNNLLVSPPSFIISGMNCGGNMCVDVFYSGTVAAACEGTFLGIPSIAISYAAYDPDADFESVVPWIRKLIEWVIETPPTIGTLYNINIPPIDPRDIRGVKVTRLGKVRYKDSYELRYDPNGRPYYWLKGALEVLDDDPDTDIIAVRSGFISITPIKFELTDYALINKISANLKIDKPEFECVSS